MTPVEQFIRKAAIARGIDPDIAIRVVMSEGGVTDPFRQSDVGMERGHRELSFGPFQLLMEGGLGEEALTKYGIDPRKDWMGGVEFALDTAARKRSWSDWHGAARVGIADNAGFGELTKPIGISLATRPNYAANSPYVPNLAQKDPTVAPPVPGTPATAGTPMAGGTGGLGGLGGLMQGLGSLAGAFGGGSVSDPSASQITPSSISGETGSPNAAQAAALMAALMTSRRKRYPKGVTLDTPGGLDGI